MAIGLSREIDLNKLDKLFVRLNNILRSRFKKRPVEPVRILLLFSHCLQNSECPNKIVVNLANCQRCGNCMVKDILEMSERYGIQCAVATGGAMALEKVKTTQVDTIVAVACEKELKEGIKGIFPKPVFAISNLRPKGPCKDCLVELEKVEKVIRFLLKL